MKSALVCRDGGDLGPAIRERSCVLPAYQKCLEIQVDGLDNCTRGACLSHVFFFYSRCFLFKAAVGGGRVAGGDERGMPFLFTIYRETTATKKTANVMCCLCFGRRLQVCVLSFVFADTTGRHTDSVPVWFINADSCPKPPAGGGTRSINYVTVRAAYGRLRHGAYTLTLWLFRVGSEITSRTKMAVSPLQG